MLKEVELLLNLSCASNVDLFMGLWATYTKDGVSHRGQILWKKQRGDGFACFDIDTFPKIHFRIAAELITDIEMPRWRAIATTTVESPTQQIAAKKRMGVRYVHQKGGSLACEPP